MTPVTVKSPLLFAVPLTWIFWPSWKPSASQLPASRVMVSSALSRSFGPSVSTPSVTALMV